MKITSVIKFPWKYKWATLSIAILLLYCFYMAYLAEIQMKESICQGRLYQWGKALESYYYSHCPYPDFRDSEGKALLSWRVVLLPLDSKKFRYDEPWNSEYNTAVIHQIEKGKGYYDNFICNFLKGSNTNAAFVALTGEGTAWTEINEGRKRHDECKDMILILETPNPKNHWAEPGDDVTPEEVIEFFTAYKNRKKNFFSPKKHFPNRFYTAGNGLGSFDDIENVEELKRRLVIQDHRDADD